MSHTSSISGGGGTGSAEQVSTQPLRLPNRSVHDSLYLYQSQDAFTFCPTRSISAGQDSSGHFVSLVIQRETFQINLVCRYRDSYHRHQEVHLVYGILGFIQLNAGMYCLIITARSKVGALRGAHIYQADQVQVLRIPNTPVSLTLQQASDDFEYLRLIHDMYNGYGYSFYFSYSSDAMTNTVARQSKWSNDVPLWQSADDRFMWNHYLLQPLLSLASGLTSPSPLDGFILPVVCGFIGIHKTSLLHSPFTFALISRRSRFRAGTRYHSRGIDEAGNVSNFVETEQVLEVGDGTCTSYVQTRGSIPLFWQQLINVKYQPFLEIETDKPTAQAFKFHFLNQIRYYGPQIVVNLINKGGYEKELGLEFARQIDSLNDPRIKYVHFDFHHECRKMKWDRISLLTDMLQNELTQQGFTYISADGTILSSQTSIVRTNCMDCLDRTNVVQSVFAKKSMMSQLQHLGIWSQGPLPMDFERLFQNIWADNADAVSCQYSGTGALKTDYTRTGKRSVFGVLNDFRNSVLRYVKNNFFDGSRQDSFDLCLGAFMPTGNFSPFLEDGARKPPIVYLLPFCAVLSLSVLVSALLVGFESRLRQFFVVLLCLVIIGGCVRVLLTYNEVFVDLPRLVQQHGSVLRMRAASRRRQRTVSAVSRLFGREEGGERHDHPPAPIRAWWAELSRIITGSAGRVASGSAGSGSSAVTSPSKLKMLP